MYVGPSGTCFPISLQHLTLLSIRSAHTHNNHLCTYLSIQMYVSARDNWISCPILRLLEEPCRFQLETYCPRLAPRVSSLNPQSLKPSSLLSRKVYLGFRVSSLLCRRERKVGGTKNLTLHSHSKFPASAESSKPNSDSNLLAASTPNRKLCKPWALKQ